MIGKHVLVFFGDQLSLDLRKFLQVFFKLSLEKALILYLFDNAIDLILIVVTVGVLFNGISRHFYLLPSLVSLLDLPLAGRLGIQERCLFLGGLYRVLALLDIDFAQLMGLGVRRRSEVRVSHGSVWQGYLVGR